MKKELQVQITTPALDVDKDTTNSYHALINEYWLNEIKSQDDAIRHLINAVVIILGVYFTVILIFENFFSLGHLLTLIYNKRHYTLYL